MARAADHNLVVVWLGDNDLDNGRKPDAVIGDLMYLFDRFTAMEHRTVICTVIPRLGPMPEHGNGGHVHSLCTRITQTEQSWWTSWPRPWPISADASSCAVFTRLPYAVGISCRCCSTETASICRSGDMSACRVSSQRQSSVCCKVRIVHMYILHIVSCKQLYLYIRSIVLSKKNELNPFLL